ncbi:hypothetical protein [Shewanella sp. 10N.286.45.A1]|uniref:hypothetical protein n=1 Tax=Shewanella sp. 10N.286.45.A1 TaxID=3229694 RepID=UPI003555D7F5
MHSYFIRVLLCKGSINNLGALNGLVSPSGAVGILPKLDKKVSSSFDYISDHLFKTLLLEHTAFNELGYFDLEEMKNYVLLGGSPADYGDGLHKIYGGKTQLRYCPECFKVQIKEYGVCWFRLDWLCSLRCKLHNSPLYHVRSRRLDCCEKPSNINRNLQAAMTGKCTFCGKCTWSNPNEIYIGDHNRHQYILFNKKELHDRVWL